MPLGPNVNGFEKDLEEFCGQNKRVVALSAGTAAVHLALIACGVGPGDEVLVQSFTFCASSHPITYLEATPVFVDSEPDTWNMDPALLEEAIKDRITKTGKTPKAIVPVALYGMPYRIDRIMEIADRYGIPVVEDAAEGFGSRAEVKELYYSDLPLLNQDIEQPEPVAVARVRKEIQEADALWIFTPEYNGSYPGHLKNLLDWLSRPVKPMDYATPTCIAGKRVALCGAGGKAATAGCRAKLTELLTFMRANVLPQQLGIALPPEAWKTDVLTLTDEQLAQLKALAEAAL